MRRAGLALLVCRSAASEQADAFERLPPTSAPLFLMGITHWWLNEGRIVLKWEVADRFPLMEQIFRHSA